MTYWADLMGTMQHSVATLCHFFLSDRVLVRLKVYHDFQSEQSFRKPWLWPKSGVSRLRYFCQKNLHWKEINGQKSETKSCGWIFFESCGTPCINKNGAMTLPRKHLKLTAFSLMNKHCFTGIYRFRNTTHCHKIGSILWQRNFYSEPLHKFLERHSNAI